MKHYQYNTNGTCSIKIDFDITDDKKVKNIQFTGGCRGNLKAIGILCEGADASEISKKLAGNTCGSRPTSCADQLSIAIKKAINE